MIMDVNGSVGIGTATARDPLHVVGVARATTFKSIVATGTAPFDITSTTVSTNLNADLLDGNHAAAFYLASNPNGYTSNTGTVTSVAVTAGSGLTGGGTITTSGTITLNVGAGTAITVNADDISHSDTSALSGLYGGSGISSVTVDDLGHVTAIGTATYYLASNPNGYTTNTGTVTSVTVSAGTGMSGGGTVTTSGTITLSNAGVTSNVAGTGVSVSGATGAVTISIGQAVATSDSPLFQDLRLNGRLGFTGSGNAGDGFPYARFVEAWGIAFQSPDNRWTLSTSNSLLVGLISNGRWTYF
jgi:hypothetical protein